MKLDEIFIIIVLYKSNLENSRTISTLGAFLNKKVNLFVYDNSPEKQYQEEKFTYNNFDIQYFHDPTNSGLSKAYNDALVLAQDKNYAWLLLLDQDTYFTKEYVEAIELLQIDDDFKNMAAIIPRVNSLNGGQQISPGKILLGGICRPLKLKEGIVNSKISGINSGTILNVEYLKLINGFNTNYTLDMLDHWYFKKIFSDGKDVFLLNAEIKQDLSVLEDFEKSVSVERYEQMLNAECLFAEEESFLSLFVFKVRLILRILKQRKFKSKKYCQLTLKKI